MVSTAFNKTFNKVSTDLSTKTLSFNIDQKAAGMAYRSALTKFEKFSLFLTRIMKIFSLDILEHLCGDSDGNDVEIGFKIDIIRANGCVLGHWRR